MKNLFKTYELIHDNCLEQTNEFKFFDKDEALAQVKEDYIGRKLNRPVLSWEDPDLVEVDYLKLVEMPDPNGIYPIDSLAVIVLHNETQNLYQYFNLKRA